MTPTALPIENGGKADLLKAIHFLQLLIDLEYKEGK